MEKQDKEVKDFFDNIKGQDLQEEIPSFDKFVTSTAPSKKWKYWLTGAAAAVLLGVFVFGNGQEFQDDAAYDIVISLEVPEESSLSLDDMNTGVYEWQSATSSLIND